MPTNTDFLKKILKKKQEMQKVNILTNSSEKIKMTRRKYGKVSTQ